VDDALGFALTWNYWFNDAVSTASDIIALQLLLKYWTDNFPGWAISLIFLVVVIALNVMSVRVYGEVCIERLCIGAPELTFLFRLNTG
jgi:AAT family amino acid transporter